MAKLQQTALTQELERRKHTNEFAVLGIKRSNNKLRHRRGDVMEGVGKEEALADDPASVVQFLEEIGFLGDRQVYMI